MENALPPLQTADSDEWVLFSVLHPHCPIIPHLRPEFAPTTTTTPDLWLSLSLTVGMQVH